MRSVLWLANSSGSTILRATRLKTFWLETPLLQAAALGHGAMSDRWLIVNRVSDRSQADKQTLETQLEDCRRYVEDRNGAVADEIVHVGSGLEPEQLYERIQGSIERNGITHIVAWKFDRYGRNEAEGHALISWLLKRGIDPESVVEGSVPAFVRSVFMALAAQDSRNISIRVRPNMRRRAEKGIHQGIVPVGYQTGDDGHLTPDPMTGPLVNTLFHLADQKRSRRTLMDFTRKHGLRTRRTPVGKTISWTAISRLLQNRCYLGELTYGRTQQSKMDELKATNGPQPRDKWVVVENAHPSLIDEATFQRVNDWIDGRKTRRVYEKANFYLLDGLVECGRCGSPMRGCKTVSKGNAYFYYMCRKRHDFYACDQPKVSCRQVDGDVRYLLLETYLSFVSESPDAFLENLRRVLIEKRQALLESFEARRKHLEHRRGEIQLMRHNLLDKKLLDVFTPRELEDRSVELADEMASIKQELASLRPIEEQRKDIDATLVWFENLKADVERYGIKNQVTLTRKDKKWALEVGPILDRQLLVPLDDVTWQRVARAFIRRVIIDGPTRGGEVRVEWTAEGESLLGEKDSVVQMVRKARR